ncbi:hypothetical protein [Taibaiella koreensis]|uniref:hypothetical protein n=1 Tax=Taibaiella koreensis TaxID=1268548 RepID=UPI000E599BA9|nr:hypothetical protein [Taibaiella koreensis]
MTKKIIYGIIAFFVIGTLLCFWIMKGADDIGKEQATRTEADFTTQQFVITELWQMQQKKQDRVLASYLFIKVRQEPINLRLPWQGGDDRDAIAGQLKEGDTITVKVMKAQLAEARKGGFFKAIDRFFMGDKREVTLFGLKAHGETLLDRDIHDWDVARISLLGRLTDQPFLLLIPFFIIMFVIGWIKRKANAKKAVS